MQLKKTAAYFATKTWLKFPKKQKRSTQGKTNCCRAAFPTCYRVKTSSSGNRPISSAKSAWKNHPLPARLRIHLCARSVSSSSSWPGGGAGSSRLLHRCSCPAAEPWPRLSNTELSGPLSYPAGSTVFPKPGTDTERVCTTLGRRGGGGSRGGGGRRRSNRAATRSGWHTDWLWWLAACQRCQIRALICDIWCEEPFDLNSNHLVNSLGRNMGADSMLVSADSS